MDLLLAQSHAVALFLHLLRVGAFVAVMPLFGRQNDSLMLRLAVMLTVGSILWWVGARSVTPPGNLLALGVMAVREGLIGFALGFALQTLSAMLVAAGEVISSEMGFALARTMNPESGVDATVVSQLLQVVGFLLILQFDLHHDALRILQQTFAAFPIGEAFDFTPIWDGLRTLMTQTVTLSLQYALPVLALMLLLTAATVLLGRAVPAINLMEFAFALRVLLALAASAWFLVAGAPFLLRAFGALMDGARAMFPVGS